MAKVKTAELRKKLRARHARVHDGETLDVTVGGRVIARIVPEHNRQAAARIWLEQVRQTARVGDVTSPSGDVWNAERSHC